MTYSQSLSSVKLSKRIKETSGLELIKGGFLTINDKGNKAILYKLNEKGTIINSYKVNSENKDWESLASDGRGLYYISDTGNNSFNRKILKILIVKEGNYNNFFVIGSIKLKIKKEDKINIEGIALVGNDIHLFNKNNSVVYVIPSKIDTYILENFKKQTISTNLLITGADYDKVTDTMFLSCYNSSKKSSIIIIANYSGIQSIKTIALEKIKGVESIKLVGENFYFTNESNNKSKAKLSFIPFQTVKNKLQ